MIGFMLLFKILPAWKPGEREREERKNGGEIEGGRVIEAHTIILTLTSLHDLLDIILHYLN